MLGENANGLYRCICGVLFLFVLLANVCLVYQGAFWDSRNVIIESEIRQMKFKEENNMLGLIIVMVVFYAPLRVIFKLAKKY